MHHSYNVKYLILRLDIFVWKYNCLRDSLSYCLLLVVADMMLFNAYNSELYDFRDDAKRKLPEEEFVCEIKR